MANKELSILFKANDKVTAAMRRISVESRDTGKVAQSSFRQADRAAKGLEAELKKLKGQQDRVNQGFLGMRKNLGGMLAGAGIATAVGAAWGKALGVVMNFDSSMAKLSTLGGTTSQIQDMSDGIRNLTRETAVNATPTELAAQAYNVWSAGITDVDENLDALRQSSKLATAGVGDMSTSVDIMTGALNAFRSQGLDAADAASVIYQSVRAGKTTVEDLAQSFGKNAGNAAAAGVSFQDYMAATAALTTITGRTSEAQNALGQAYNETTKDGTKFQKALERGGIGMEAWRTMVGEQGLVGSLEVLQKRLGYSDLEMKNLFGSAEAGTAIFQLLSVAGDSYRSTLDATAKGTGEFEEAVVRGNDSMEGSLKRVSGAWENYALGLQDAGLSEWFSTAADAAEGLFDWLGEGKLGEALGDWIYGIGAMDEEFALAWEGFKIVLVETLDGMATAINDWNAAIAADLWKGVKTWVNPLNWFKDETVGHSIIPDTLLAWQSWFGRLPEFVNDPIKNTVDQGLADLTRLEDGLGPLLNVGGPAGPKKKLTAEQKAEQNRRSAEGMNELVTDARMDQLAGFELQVAKENELYNEQLANFDRYYQGLDAHQKTLVDANNFKEEITSAHNARMAEIDTAEADRQAQLQENERIQGLSHWGKIVAQNDTEQAAREQWAQTLESSMMQTSDIAADTMADWITGTKVSGKKLEQAFKQMLAGALDSQGNYHVLTGLAKVAESIYPPNPTQASAGAMQIGKGMAMKTLAAMWGKSSSSGGGKDKGGGGRKKDRESLPNRNAAEPQKTGVGKVVVDLGGLRGKMVVGDAANVAASFMEQFNDQYRRDVDMEFV